MAGIRSGLIAFIVAVLLGAGPGAVTSVQAQTPPEWDEMLPNQMPDCPPALESRFPKCAMAMMVTTDEKWVACYCKGNVGPETAPTFPDPKVKRRSVVTIEKLVPQAGGPDPCGTLTINGKKKYVCW